MAFLCLDIETIPNAKWLNPRVVEPTVEWAKEHEAAMQKDPGFFGDMVAKGEVPLLQTGVVPSLHPTTCQVVQVSFGTRNEDGTLWTRIVQADDYMAEGVGLEATEEAVLRDAFDIIGRSIVKGALLVTFNGKGFDLPVLRWRAALRKVAISRLRWSNLMYPYKHDEHCDLRLAFSDGDKRAKGTQQVWSDAFEIHAEEHGRDVWPWVRAGKWPELRRYGEVEQGTLVALYERVRAYI